MGLWVGDLAPLNLSFFMCHLGSASPVLSAELRVENTEGHRVSGFGIPETIPWPAPSTREAGAPRGPELPLLA